MVGVNDSGAVTAAFDNSVAVVLGVEYAREWGNRPANHATPTLLAEAAKALGLSPRTVEKLRAGLRAKFGAHNAVELMSRVSGLPG